MLQPTSLQVQRLPAIAARVASLLPLWPLELALKRLLAGILARHPELIGRLEGVAWRPISVEPDDLPFIIILEPAGDSMSLRLARSLKEDDAGSRIRGPLLALIGLVDGVYDGDALFFSRDLVIEGDIETVLALRNAIDDADVDMLQEVAATLGLPLDKVARRAARGLRNALGQRGRTNQVHAQ